MKRKSIIALRVILTVFSVLAVGFIFYNSIETADVSGERSARLMGYINAILHSMGLDISMSDHLIRKTAHFVEYFVLGGLLNGAACAYVFSRRRTLLIALPAGLAVTVCDELIQTMSAGRSCEIKDMALDFSAVLCASLLFALIHYAAQRKKVRKEGKNRERTKAK